MHVLAQASSKRLERALDRDRIHEGIPVWHQQTML